MIAGKYRIEPLQKHHERSVFQCGTEELDRYLHQQAGQEERRNVAMPFVLTEPPVPDVIGYYSLSSLGVEHEAWPLEIAKKLPRYPQLPVTLLGRLAVDIRHRGGGLGKGLLMDALYRSWQASRQIGSMAVIVDAIDQKAREFYEAFDFVAFPDEERRLYLPMATIASLFIG